MPSHSQLQQKEQLYRNQQNQRFNASHKAYIQLLQCVDTVWLPKFQQNVTILSEVVLRSYMIQTSTERVRKNQEAFNKDVLTT